MASAHNTTNGEVQQQEKKLENMDLNSKEVEPPMNFYLSSLEEQVRCDLKDSEAKITPTPSEGRILLEIDEDLLQHFLDCLQEKNEGELQTERLRSQEKTTTQEFMEPHRASCLVQLGEQRDMIEKLEAALEKAEQDQKTGALQWEDEKSSLIAEKEEVWDKYHAQLKIIASLRTQEKEAMKKLERVQASHQVQLEDQTAETNRIAADLKNTADLLELERLCCQELSSLTTTLEASQSNCLAKLKMQDNDNKNLMASLKKTFEDQLESERVLWQQEKDSFRVQLGHHQEENNNLLAAVTQAEQLLKRGTFEWQQEKSSLDDAHLKIIASFRTQEKEAMQKLERTQASHQVQLEDQTAEINRIAADLKNTADLLELERLCCQELSSFTTTLEASQSNCLAKLEMQDNDNKNLMASLKKKFEDQLESERVLCQQEKDSFRVQLGHHQEENNNLLAAVTQAEQLLKRGSMEWQQEKASLLQATENLQQTLHKQQQERQTTESSLKSQLEDLQSQITNKQKKKKKWYKLF